MRIGDDFSITHPSRIPLYEQIARYLRKKIVAGQLSYLQRLPPSRVLAAHLRVHFNTVLRAYRRLRGQGLVRIFERFQGWIEPARISWLPETIRYKAQFEIKAHLREALSVGIRPEEISEWLKTTAKEVFDPFRESPDEILRRLRAKYG